MKTLYTVKGPDALLHGSTDAHVTACGLDIDHNWEIVSNAFDGVVTCPKCLVAIRDLAYSELP